MAFIPPILVVVLQIQVEDFALCDVDTERQAELLQPFMGEVPYFHPVNCSLSLNGCQVRALVATNESSPQISSGRWNISKIIKKGLKLHEA